MTTSPMTPERLAEIEDAVWHSEAMGETHPEEAGVHPRHVRALLSELAREREAAEDARMVAWAIENWHTYRGKGVAIQRAHGGGKWVLMQDHNVAVWMENTFLPVLTPEARAIIAASESYRKWRAEQ